MQQGTPPWGPQSTSPACDPGSPPADALAMTLLCSGIRDVNGKKTDRVPTPQGLTF